MIKIAGHWEIGYMTPIMEANFWNLVLRDFEVDEWYMTPVSGIRHNEQKLIPLKEFHDYNEMLADETLQKVFLEPRTNHQNPDTTWLHDFEHPKNCIYIFGSAHFNPTLFYKKDQDKIVSIKTIQDKGVLWSNQCLSIVLYDRMVKSWQ